MSYTISAIGKNKIPCFIYNKILYLSYLYLSLAMTFCTLRDDSARPLRSILPRLHTIILQNHQKL